MEKLTNKQLIVVIAILLIVFFLFSNILKELRNNNIKINYGQVSGEILVNESLETYDRATFLTLNGIIVRILKSYELGTQKEYYNALTADYKKSLSSEEFANRIDTLCSKFKVEPINDDTYIETDKVLTGVYKYLKGSDMYICKLSTNAYIGIKLNSSQKYYDIFYIE